MRYLGLDVHRDFCEVAICERGRARSVGRIETTREALELFASSLGPDDHVVLESTGNALAIAGILRRHVSNVVLANPMQVRAISHAKVKNDRVDARTLAELLAADLLPQVWIADEPTRALRSEWEFESALKPDYGFPLYYGWLCAITDSFAKVHRGLAIQCPVLSMHSDEADVVLNWRHIAKWSRLLGPSVKVMAFPGAWHDLILSPAGIREEIFRQLFAWAERSVALAA